MGLDTSEPKPNPATSSKESTYKFTPHELTRLAIYRTAINASFYTDQCAPLAQSSEEELTQYDREIRDQLIAAKPIL